jgi:hypothetical protein
VTSGRFTLHSNNLNSSMSQTTEPLSLTMEGEVQRPGVKNGRGCGLDTAGLCSRLGDDLKALARYILICNSSDFVSRLHPQR